MKREGLAGITVDRVKALVDAQTQREVEEIRTGQKSISDFSVDLKFAKAKDFGADIKTRAEPMVGALDYSEIFQIGHDRVIADAIRREINTANTILYAEDVLREDDAIPPKEKVDEDWLFRWRDYAGEVSDDDLQILWGRVLAGEVKLPGTYSKRCLEFLRSLSQPEAKLIEVLCSLVVADFIWRPDTGFKLPLEFNDLLDLEDLGVVGGVTGSLTLKISDEGVPGEPWIQVLSSNEKCLIIKNSDKQAELVVPAYSITKLGKQLLSLGDFKADVEYLSALGRSIVGKGFEVMIADLDSRTTEYIGWKNGVKIV